MVPITGSGVNGERVQAVVRAFTILRTLAAAREPVLLGRVSVETGLPKSTVSRLLTTLESIGMVERGPADGTYTIGSGVESISRGHPSANRLQGVAHPYLGELVAELGESAALAVADGDGLIYTAQVQSAHPIQVPDWSGSRFLPHTVAAGFVFMAWWEEARLDHYLSQKLAPSSGKTLTDPAEIRSRIQVVRQDGYCWALDEWVEGISAVAAPVLDDAGSLMAVISVFGPSYRFPTDRDQAAIGERVIESATAIASHLV